MNSRTGIVVEIKRKKACIMTSDGEFTEVKIGDTIPTIGSTYTGITEKNLSFHKYVAAVACLVLFTSIGSGAYAYYTPTASVVVSINPALELKLNRWNKIIKTIALNEDGNQLASSIDIKNKDIDTGLAMILDEAERENFINKDEAEEEPKVSLNITSSKDISLTLPKFEQKASSKKLDVQIDYSKEITKDDIIKNGNELEKDIENNSNNPKKDKKTDSNPKSSLPKVKSDNKVNDNKNNGDKAKPKDSKSQNNSDKGFNNSNEDNKSTSTTKEKTKKTMNNKKNSNSNSQPSKGKSRNSNNKTNNSKSNKNEDTKK